MMHTNSGRSDVVATFVKGRKHHTLTNHPYYRVMSLPMRPCVWTCLKENIDLMISSMMADADILI